MPTLQRTLVATASAVLFLACSASTGDSRNAAAGPESSPKPASDEAAAEPDAAGQKMHVSPKEAVPKEAEPKEAEPKEAEPASPAAASDQMKAGAARKCKDGKHEIGDRWKDDCNDCWCNNDGSIVCTRMACKKD